ncbi:MAG: hypothetical protein DRG78_00700 [Epsilonproteobacteria bacterium]|nr:MAG: hypothetical protein DRG78_00700 [Campylobacterota bacterium]
MRHCTYTKIENGISRALREGNIIFDSRQKFSDYCGVRSQHITSDIVEKINAKGILLTVQRNNQENRDKTELKINLAIERAISIGKLEFSSKQEFCLFAGLRSALVKNENIEKIAEMGVKITVQKNSKEVQSEALERINKGIEKALQNKKYEFMSKNEFALYCNSRPKIITNNIINIAKDKGVFIYVQENSKQKHEKVRIEINAGLDRALKSHKNIFISRREFAAHCKVSPLSITKNIIENAKKKGVLINIQKNSAIKEEEKLSLIDSFLNKALSNNIRQFDSKQNFANYCGLTVKGITGNIIQRSKDAGVLIIVQKTSQEKKTEQQEKIKIGIKKAVEHKIFQFDSKQSFATYSEIRSRAITSRVVEEAKKSGISITTKKSFQEKRNDMMQKVKDGIERSLKEGVHEFASKRELLEYFKISANSFTAEMYRILDEKGIFISHGKTKTQAYIIKEIIRHNIKIEIEAFCEFADNILNLTVKNISRSDCQLLNDMEISIEMTNTEKTRIVEDALEALGANKEKTLWILEIKLQIYLFGYYLCEDTIMSILTKKDINTKDTINARMRYARMISLAGLVSVKFSSTLPAFNSSRTPTVHISSAISDNFVQLWKEYAAYLIKNNLAGSITKSKLPNGWNGTFDNIAKLYPIYKKAFMLDENIKFLEENGFEIIAALAFVGGKRAKNDIGSRWTGLPRVYHSIRSRASGFLLWLLMRESVIFHPKYLVMTGGTYMSNLVNFILKDHDLFKVLNNAKNSTRLSERARKTFLNGTAHVHLYKLCTAVSRHNNLLSISLEEFERYIASAAYYSTTPDNNMSHFSFLQNICLSAGNTMVLVQKEQETISEKIDRLISAVKIKDSTRDRYIKLTITAKKLALNASVGDGQKSNYITAYLLLLEFLNNFNVEISSDKMISILNIDHQYDEELHLSKWLKENKYENKFSLGQTFIKKLFQISPIRKYRKVFSLAIVIDTKNKKRTFVRGGFPKAIYHTLQNIAFSTPAKCKNFPIMRTFYDGQNIDMEWWDKRCPNSTNDTSPVMATLIWLASKLPRRSMHIRNLDVETFLQYDNYGQLNGFFINSDKNKDIASYDREFIPKYMLDLIFTEAEYIYLEDYVKYIKLVFSAMPKQKYTGDNHNELIQPLFPGDDGQSIINKTHVFYMYNKTIMLTQFEVRKLSNGNYYDIFYNHDTLEKKKKELRECELLYNRKNKYRKIPESLEEMLTLDYPDSVWHGYFATLDGMHNLRHAGASALSADGIDFETITYITGHINDRLLRKIYVHLREEDFRRRMSRISPSAVSQMDGISIKRPQSVSNSFVHQLDKELCGSENQQYILEKLEENGFISLTRTIISSDKNLYGDYGEIEIKSGLEIAASFDPNTMWKYFNHGICPINMQCPQGTHGICSLCPNLLFNGSHIEGIAHKIREISLLLDIYSRKSYEASMSGTNSERTDIGEKFNINMHALYGYYEMLSIAGQQLVDAGPSDDSDSNSLNSDNLSTSNMESIFSIYSVEQNELLLDMVSGAKALNIDNEHVQNNINTLSFKAIKKAAMDGNQETLAQLEKRGISFIIDQWGSLKTERKKQELMDYFSKDEKNTALLDI